MARIANAKQAERSYGKNLVRDKGLLSFCNGCRNGEVRCNGRSKQGKDALSVCAQGLCKDAKPTKHTQTLALRKVGGIVQMQTV